MSSPESTAGILRNMRSPFAPDRGRNRPFRRAPAKRYKGELRQRVALATGYRDQYLCLRPDRPILMPWLQRHHRSIATTRA